MRDPSLNPLLCSVDPVSATILALGTAAGGAAEGFLGGKQSASPSPAAPPPPAPPIQQPQGTPGGNAAAASGTPSFIGSSSLPPQQGYGSKTLLGQ